MDGESIMNDAIFVLNAGSSSLKFSIYGLKGQDLGLAAHGEIEGLALGALQGEGSMRPNVGGCVLGDSTRNFGHAEAFAHFALGLRAFHRCLYRWP